MSRDGVYELGGYVYQLKVGGVYELVGFVFSWRSVECTWWLDLFSAGGR